MQSFFCVDYILYPLARHDCDNIIKNNPLNYHITSDIITAKIKTIKIIISFVFISKLLFVYYCLLIYA